MGSNGLLEKVMVLALVPEWVPAWALGWVLVKAMVKVTVKPHLCNSRCLRTARKQGHLHSRHSMSTVAHAGPGCTGLLLARGMVKATERATEMVLALAHPPKGTQLENRLQQQSSIDHRNLRSKTSKFDCVLCQPQ